MKKRRYTVLIASLILAVLTISGCGKENKYVNVGIEESTPGLSLYLTNTAKGLEKISTYVFFSTDMDETFEKISMDKQGIDISYVPVDEIARIKKDSNFRVVFIDCFETSGDIKGVWIARDTWLNDAPNYSKKYIKGMVKSLNYRTDHMNLSYEEALSSIEGMRDFDFDVQDDVLQFVAIFDKSNDDVISDYPFISKSASDMKEMFKDFSLGSGEGYELCKKAYDTYCTSFDAMGFEDMFDLKLMMEEIEEVLNSEE